MLRWEITNELAGSHRPGWPGEAVDPSEVDGWISEIKALGIKSIICFLADDQLGFYSTIPAGLTSYYRESGFNVEHIPAPDYQKPPLTDEHLERVWKAYVSLPKPVLVHCSAGLDRTGLALAHIQQRLRDS